MISATYTQYYQILTVPGTFPYSKFKNAPEGSLMNIIYNEKVKTVPIHKQLGAITFEERVSVLLNEKYVAYHEMDSFTSYTEFRYGTSSQNRILFKTICITYFPELILTLHFLFLKTVHFENP